MPSIYAHMTQCMKFYKDRIDEDVKSVYKNIPPFPMCLVVKRVHCTLPRDKAIKFYSTVAFKEL